MTIKTYERPIIELAQSLAFKRAKLIDSEYKLKISDLNHSEKLDLISQFTILNANLDQHLQEFLDDACLDMMYAESQQRWGWDE